VGNIRTSINIDENLLNELDEIARINDRSRSKEMIRAIQEYVDRYYSPSGEHPQLNPNKELQELQRTAREQVLKNPEILLEIYNELLKEKKS